MKNEELNTILEEAKRVVNYLQVMHERGVKYYGHETFTIYIPKEDIVVLEKLLVAHQRQIEKKEKTQWTTLI